MSWLPHSIGVWIAGALLLFWFVGAYNRLMRLRTVVRERYVTVDTALLRQLAFVRASVGGAADAPVAEAPTQAKAAVEAAADADASLSAAAAQMDTLLSATRPRPLEPERMAALGTALMTMLTVWQSLHPDRTVSFDADGAISRADPLDRDDEPSDDHGNPIAWPEPSAAAEIARGQFNLAVSQYNAAVGQFPAVLVAWIVRFRSAAPLL